MDVMNDLYKGQCLVLPNEYILLTGELRETNHTRCAYTLPCLIWVHSAYLLLIAILQCTAGCTGCGVEVEVGSILAWQSCRREH